jgi:hypothetical protein
VPQSDNLTTNEPQSQICVRGKSHAPPESGRKRCRKCLEKQAVWDMNRRLKAVGERICMRCCIRPASPRWKYCAKCHVNRREAQLPGLEHDFEAHLEMVKLSQQAHSQCMILGRSALSLWKVGERLSVDRINPNLGYVQGNMRLITLSLNTSKGVRDYVAQHAINLVLNKLDRTCENRLDEVPGATRVI